MINIPRLRRIMRRAYAVVSVIALSSALPATGQAILFDHLRTGDGISEYSVNAIYQDEFERIWIATKDGLNLYDGKNIEVFRPVMGDSTSIMGHNIHNVTSDRNGTLYVHCLMGLMSYDMRRQKFEVLLDSDVERISMGKEYLWFSFRNGLSRLDGKTRKAELYYLFDKEINITCIYEAGGGVLYVGTRDHGLMMLDAERKVTNMIPGINTLCIFEDSANNIWAGSFRNGLFCIGNGRITNYRHNPADKNSLSNDFVRCISQDNFGNYWIGTFDGLNRFDREANQFLHYYHSYERPYSIGSNSIWCITKDKQGTIWIGSYYGCVDRFNPEYLFSHYYTPESYRNGLCGEVVGCAVEDRDGNLWICSENSGLNFLDRATGKFRWYMNEDYAPNSNRKKALKDLYYDAGQNCIWIGTHLNGLHRMNLADKSVVRVDFTGNPSGNDYVRRILPCGDKLALGTHNSVYIVDKRTGRADWNIVNKGYNLADRQIWDMLIDRRGRLWFSTSSEVYRYVFDSDQLVCYAHDPNDPASLQSGNNYVFAEDREGRIWIGSAGGGVSVIDVDADSFRRFDTSNSQIIDNYVTDIMETPMGYILIATNEGLSRFDFRNDLFHNYYNTIYPLSMLSERALGKTSSGELIISGVNGMLIINENELDIKPSEYSVGFTRLSVNNTVVRPGDDTGILRQAIEYTDTIELHPRHTVFRLDFATSNYISALHPVVQYKLEGFDDDWITAPSHDNINYTNLSPGEYRLVVRSGPGSGEWYGRKELIIIVHPPFYATTLAYIIYILSFLAILYLLIRYYTKHIRLKSSLEFAEREKMRVKELNAVKLNFFTNASHELRTPLTLIISQLEVISRQDNLPSAVSKRVLGVLRNTDKMNRLIGEILDFQKQESGFLQLKVEQSDLSAYIHEVIIPFREYALNRGIFLNIDTPADGPVMVWFDRAQMEKVIYNLLSNAFKATKPGGQISVRVSQKEETAVIRVEDTGCGISPDDIGRIFNRFYQEPQQSGGTGTGIGLALSRGIVEAHNGVIAVESRLNEGAVFTVSLLLGDSHFDYTKVRKKTFRNAESVVIPEPVTYGDVCDTETDGIEVAAGISPLPELPAVPEAGKRHTILIVEDNSELLETLVDIFSSYYNTHTASDGAEGLAKTEELQPDIVLSDVIMPVMDGVEMCKRIKSNFNTCHIPVVLLTARAAVEHIVFGLKHSADDYIVKPFNACLLLARCNNIINNRLSLQAYYRRSPNSDVKLVATTAYDQELLDKATRLVEANIDNPDFDIDRFAKEMCLGRTNLFRKIKGITGQTPNEFIINIRLKRSLVLLKEDLQMPVYQIAMQVGFNEDTYFMRCFKKTFGKTPTQYREELSE